MSLLYEKSKPKFCIEVSSQQFHGYVELHPKAGYEGTQIDLLKLKVLVPTLQGKEHTWPQEQEEVAIRKNTDAD